MGKKASIFAGMILLTVLLAYTAAFGLTVGDWLIPSVFNDQQTETYGIRKGLDLVGGSVITYEAQRDENNSDIPLSEGMDTAIAMLRQRLNNLGYLEAQITKVGSDRIRIEIPAISNPKEAMEKLGATAQLEFLDSDNNVVLTGSDIKGASAEYGRVKEGGTEEHYVKLEFTPEAINKFAAATKAASEKEEGKNYIAITLDKEVISSPSVNEEINSDSAIITGRFTAEDAKWLAGVISAGRLPFSLKDVELRSVGPELGEKALDNGLTAGGIGLILIFIILILVYRWPGFLASLALVFYTALLATILAILKVNLSLPGIAGVILSIGMAVDANVIIFERIKEELSVGKTIRASVDAGFKRALTAILDSNVTTIIAAAVLWYFGTGTIKGFAITLFWGVLVSMFTAVTWTRLYLSCSIDMSITKPSLYGVSAKKEA